MERQKNKNAGFTLIELLIAVAILALALIPLFQTIVMSGRLNAKSRDVLKGTDLGQNLMERMTSDTWESISGQLNEPSSGFHLHSSQEFAPTACLPLTGAPSAAPVSGSLLQKVEAEGHIYYYLLNVAYSGRKYHIVLDFEKENSTKTYYLYHVKARVYRGETDFLAESSLLVTLTGAVRNK